MKNQDYIVGLDIGTTKICAIVGRKNEHGKIEILGIGKADSFGVNRGVVANIEKTVDAIKKAVAEAEKNSGVQIKNVYVGIAGQHIRSLQHRGIITRDNADDEISKADIKRLINDMHKLVVNPGDKIIHVLPQEFIVDNEPGIKDPVGMSGIRLEANFHIITGQQAAANNIYKCVQRAGLEVVDMILEPIASSAAVLSEEEKEAGVALVDIGGGTTDIAIFQDSIIRHTYVIPFGGNSITDDIKEGCLIMRDQAEKVKTMFGCAIEDESQENQVITIKGLRGREPKEISLRNLSRVIQARMAEILEYVDSEINRSDFRKKLIAGVVITGGGANLKHLRQLVELQTGMDARIGLPTEHLAPSKLDLLSHPMYSTGVGLIIKGYEEYENRKIEQRKEPIVESAEPEEKTEESRQNWFSSLFEKGKNWFKDEDNDDFKTY